MSYKNYLAITGIRTKPEEPSSAEKFEALDNEAGSDVFKNTTSVYPEVDQALGTTVRKDLVTIDFSDETKLKAFQEKFLTTEGGKYAAYPTQRLGDFFSADIINVVRRMQDPTGNQFIVPVPSNLKDKFSEIFQGSITNEPAKYKGTPGLSRFELDFNNGNPSYEQVLQLRTFMTLMESEYSTQTKTKVTTGDITANDIAEVLGPDMATLYDFAFEETEKVFHSETIKLSEEFPKVNGPIVNAYLHAKQGIAMDQPLKADDFFTRAMDGRIIQNDFLGVLDLPFYSSYLEEVQSDKATFTYKTFEKALALNGKSMGTMESYAWDLDAEERKNIQTTLDDLKNAIYVKFDFPINNADGTKVFKIQVQSIFGTKSDSKNTVVTANAISGTVPDAQANGQLTHAQKNAEIFFDQYLKARGY